MMVKVIESKENSFYKEMLKLKKGDAEKGLFLAEGDDLFVEAKKAGAHKGIILPLQKYGTVNDTNIDVYFLKEHLYRELASYKSLPPVISICQKSYDSEFGDRVIYLDGVQDPGNCGTIIRTALAFSYSAVVLSKDAVSLYNNKVIQSTKGALFHLSIGRESLEVLKSMGYNIYLTTLSGVDEKKITSLQEPFCLVFGNEGTGIRKEHLGMGKQLKISMNGIDSLNVAVSSGIFMYRFQKE